MRLCPEDGPRPGWLEIPYLNLSGSWGNRYRNLNPDSKKDRYWNPSGQEMHLYNPEGHGPHSEVIVLCEGELDTIIMNQAGFPGVGVGGVGTGTSFRREWALLYAEADMLIAFDGDEPGRAAAEKLAMALDGMGLSVYIVPIPDGHDVNDWYLSDPEGFVKTMTDLVERRTR